MIQLSLFDLGPAGEPRADRVIRDALAARAVGTGLSPALCEAAWGYAPERGEAEAERTARARAYRGGV